MKAVALVEREPCNGELAMNLKLPLACVWRQRGKCPLATGDVLMEIEGLTDVRTNIFIKSNLLNEEDFKSMHGNTKPINSVSK